MTVTLRHTIDRFSIHQPHSPCALRDGYVPRGETIALGPEEILVFKAMRQTFVRVEGTNFFVRKVDIT